MHSFVLNTWIVVGPGKDGLDHYRNYTDKIINVDYFSFIVVVIFYIPGNLRLDFQVSFSLTMY